MDSKRELTFLIAGIVSLLITIFLVGFYVRTGGRETLVATTIAAMPAGFIMIVTSFTLRNASRRIQLIWCATSLILLRSVQLWKPGIDFRDELKFIKEANTYFQTGVPTGYLYNFPANIPFAGIFYGLSQIWQSPESFELLQFFVYPLLVVGYYFLAKEVAELKSNLFISNSYIPAIMLLSFAPVFQIIPTYYWPQLLGLTVLCFSFASLLHFLSCTSGLAKWGALTIGFSILLMFVHNISSALFLFTILFFFLTIRDGGKRQKLWVVGVIAFVTFMAAHLDQYSWLVQRTILMLLGNSRGAQGIERLSFADLASVIAKGPVVTLATVGFFLVVGLLVLVSSYRIARLAKTQPTGQKHRLTLFRRFLSNLIADPIGLSFVGFSVLAFISGVFLKGLLDPTRMIGWASLLALPLVIPNKKRNALLFVVVLLALFFLLIWTVNSPWGSPFGSNPNLTTPPSS